MGLIAEAMVIHPTPPTPKMDIGLYRIRREVGWCEHEFWGWGEMMVHLRGDRAE